MSDFLQSLVLRAAGLPLSAAPEPRTLPAAEPLELAPDETPEPQPDETTPKAPPRVEHEPARERTRTPPETIEPGGAPKSVIEQFHVVHEETHEVREPDAPFAEPRSVVEAQPVTPPEPVRTVERDVFREREQPVPREAAAPQVTVQPQPRPIEVPRETVVEREREAAPPAEAAPREREQPPVVLQPIVVDQTRTIVEPLREERVVIERRTEHVVEPAGELPELDAPRQPETPRTHAEPRVEPQPTAPTAEEPKGTEPPEMLVEAPPEDDRAPVAAVPRTLVLPQPPAQSAEDAQPQPEPEVAIHIGTIEIRAAAPPPPPAPPAPSVTIHRAPEPPSNFDDYASLRNYHFPDVW